MSSDFIRLTRTPTPEELLAQLQELVPHFGSAWQQSVFVGDERSFTVHGIFSEFSSYVRSHFTEFDERTWSTLFRYVEQCVTTDVHSEAGVSNAACTCFLENLAGEGELSHIVSRYLGPESRKYFDKWNG